MKNSKRYLITITAILSVLLLFASCGGKDGDTDTETNVETESISAEFSDTDSPDTDINPDEIILPNEDDFSNPDFVIEKGVLVKYLGEDTVVLVPDTVWRIGELAFSYSPAAENICEIRLSRNVKEIDPRAFFYLNRLTNFEGNNNFSFSDGFLKSNLEAAEKSLAYFDFSGSAELDFYSIYEEVTSFDTVLCESGYIVFGEAVFEIEYSSETEVFSVMGVNVFEKDISLLAAASSSYYSPITCAPTAETKVISAENMYIVTDFIHGKAGSLWCISAEGVYENHSFGSDENAYVLWFTVTEDGTLSYERWVKKYYHPTYVYDVLEYCVSREEFCSDRGKVTFEGTEPIFSTEESFKVSDIYDLDLMFAQWTEGTKQTDFEKVDDLIEFNRKNNIYE